MIVAKMIILAEPSSGAGLASCPPPSADHAAQHVAVSEKLCGIGVGDWRIGHAQKDREAQEMGQSASFILAISLWAQCVRVSSKIKAGLNRSMILARCGRAGAGGIESMRPEIRCWKG